MKEAGCGSLFPVSKLWMNNRKGITAGKPAVCIGIWMKRQIEILAPAGSYDSMKGAFNAGADAVYMGGEKFGARAFAQNPDRELMQEAIDYAHLHNKRIYMTVNTLLKEEELEEQLYEYLLPYYERGLDAVIVQDIGVLSYIRRNYPDIPLHASTQMTITGEQGIRLLEEQGVSRVVLSRELSLEEIGEIREHTDMEIEAFVHGALCYCYSGQCLMSSMIGGRSGNRGRCAQPCRMPYSLQDGRIGYYLSPKDICTIDIIPELAEAGIDSFKIEGRMKRPEYAAWTAHIYKKYTRLYLELGKEGYDHYLRVHAGEKEQDIQSLMDLYNRGGFSTGYYNNRNSKTMMSMSRPNHSGVLAGTVVGVKGNKALIKAETRINPKDVLEFRADNGKTIYDYTVKDGCGKGSVIPANFKSGLAVAAGLAVYRTKNEYLLSKIEEKYLNQEKQEPIRGQFTGQKGCPSRLRVSMGEISVQTEGPVVEQAKNAPAVRESIVGHLSKTGGTPFYFEQLDCKIDPDIFIPVGQLKQLRREAAGLLAAEILRAYRRIAVPIQKDRNRLRQEPGHYGYKTAVSVLTKEQADIAVLCREVDAVYLRMERLSASELAELLDQAERQKKECFLVLPVILRRKGREQLEKEWFGNSQDRWESRITGIVVKNYEELEWMKEYSSKKQLQWTIVADYNLYTVNKEAEKALRELGADRTTASPELNYKELRQLNLSQSELIVYGHIPLMTSAGCLNANLYSCSGEEGMYTLKDRLGKEFHVMNYCRFCYNVIYNGEPLSLMGHKQEIQELGPHTLRLEFTMESKEKTAWILKNYAGVFRYNKENSLQKMQSTKGHFKRGME